MRCKISNAVAQGFLERRAHISFTFVASPFKGEEARNDVYGKTRRSIVRIYAALLPFLFASLRFTFGPTAEARSRGRGLVGLRRRGRGAKSGLKMFLLLLLLLLLLGTGRRRRERHHSSFSSSSFFDASSHLLFFLPPSGPSVEEPSCSPLHRLNQ